MKLILIVFCSLLLTNTIFTQDLSSTSDTQSSKSLTMQTNALPQNAKYDFDGDRKADIAVFGKEISLQDRKGIWYILQSSNQKARYEFFGAEEDQSVASDYDGDGRADIAVYRPSNGFWYILQSSDSKFTAVQFGMPKALSSPQIDLPVPADYDGDGKTDIAVFRTTTGTWYLLQSSKGFAAVQWGMQEDIPIPSRIYSY